MQLTLARRAAGLVLLTALAAGCGAAGANHAAVTGRASVSPAPAATRLTAPVTTPAPAATAMSSPVKTPAARHRRRHHHRAAVPAVTAPPAPPASMNPIPQGNGGDHDADNNGGPVDGDGAI